MRIVPLVLLTLSLIVILTCSKDDTLKQDSGKEIARIFFTDAGNNMDVEEVRGDSDNQITCKLVGTLGPGIRVIVLGSNNRRFELDFRFIEDEGFYARNTNEVLYQDENGQEFEAIGNGLQNVQIFWRRNFDICEFTFKADPAPVELRANNGSTVFIDSLRIETLREDE